VAVALAVVVLDHRISRDTLDRTATWREGLATVRGSATLARLEAIEGTIARPDALGWEFGAVWLIEGGVLGMRAMWSPNEETPAAIRAVGGDKMTRGAPGRARTR
jgi:hypothetical protein